jgi:hypothetical protein
MLFQFNSSNDVDCTQAAADGIENDVRAGLSRFEPRLTRIELHIGDSDGPRDGPLDKHCRMEARPNGLAPVAVSHAAGSVSEAVAGATTKMLVVLERLFGKRTDRKGH